MNSDELEIEQIQMNLLLDAIHQRYDFDFRSYARSSLKRRIREFIKTRSLKNYYQLIEQAIENKNFFEEFVSQVAINVTEMFRDPTFYKHLREKIIPVLKTYPSIRIWDVGCSTGEEAISLAIVLKEEQLLARSQIFASDLNALSIQHALNATYDLDKIKKYTENYNQSGGKNSFSEYYNVRYNKAYFIPEIREQIEFIQHNLVKDGLFGQFHLILCRNVLIYFNRELQNNVLSLLYKGLEHYGYLCLGMKETLSTTKLEDKFESIDMRTKIYRKKGW